MTATRKYPDALWQPLPEDETQPKRERTRCTLILHSQVGNYDLNPFFGRGSVVVESHMQQKKTGKMEQMVGLDRTADANYRANSWAISVETTDDGDPDTDPWNDHQIEEMARFAAWLHENEGLPLRACSSWTDEGIGYHSQFDEWTAAKGIGKTCPGKARIDQVPSVIARAKAIVNGDEMALTDSDLTKIANAVWDRQLRRFPDGPDTNKAGVWLTSAQTGVNTLLSDVDNTEVKTAIANLSKQVLNLQAAVAAIPTSPTAIDAVVLNALQEALSGIQGTFQVVGGTE